MSDETKRYPDPVKKYWENIVIPALREWADQTGYTEKDAQVAFDAIPWPDVFEAVSNYLEPVGDIRMGGNLGPYTVPAERNKDIKITMTVKNTERNEMILAMFDRGRGISIQGFQREVQLDFTDPEPEDPKAGDGNDPDQMELGEGRQLEDYANPDWPGLMVDSGEYQTAEEAAKEQGRMAFEAGDDAANPYTSEDDGLMEVWDEGFSEAAEAAAPKDAEPEVPEPSNPWWLDVDSLKDPTDMGVKAKEEGLGPDDNPFTKADHPEAWAAWDKAVQDGKSKPKTPRGRKKKATK